MEKMDTMDTMERKERKKDSFKYYDGVAKIEIKPLIERTAGLNEDFEIIEERKKVYQVVFKSEYFNLNRIFYKLEEASELFEDLKGLKPNYSGLNLDLYNLKIELFKNRKNKPLFSELIKDFYFKNEEELEKKEYLLYDLNGFLEGLK